MKQTVTQQVDGGRQQREQDSAGQREEDREAKCRNPVRRRVEAADSGAELQQEAPHGGNEKECGCDHERRVDPRRSIEE